MLVKVRNLTRFRRDLVGDLVMLVVTDFFFGEIFEQESRTKLFPYVHFGIRFYIEIIHLPFGETLQIACWCYDPWLKDHE